jgi:hypothetical protein
MFSNIIFCPIARSVILSTSEERLAQTYAFPVSLHYIGCCLFEQVARLYSRPGLFVKQLLNDTVVCIFQGRWDVHTVAVLLPATVPQEAQDPGSPGSDTAGVAQ